MDYLQYFPDKYFDIAVCDPPYGLKEHGGKNRSGYVKQKNGSKIYVKDGGYEKQDWDNSPPKEDYFHELIRVSKNQIIFGVNYFKYSLPGGRIIWDKCNQGSDQSSPPKEDYFHELIRVSKNQIIFGVNYFKYSLPGGRIIWDKCNQGSDQSDAEIAYCSMNNRVDIFRYMWRGMFQGKSIEEGTVQQGNKKLNEKRIMPTQKPINLYRWIIQNYIQPDWKVLDTHVGSASSLIAYEESKILYIGFEKNQHNYELANKRLQEFKSQITLWDCGVEQKC